MKYYFDKDAAERAVGFIEKYCSHVKGDLAGKQFILEKWQKEEVIKPLFGWKKQDGTRKYRTCYVEVPKKNGKTTLAASVALYLLFADGEKGAEIYSAAAERDQAAISFDIAAQMVLNNQSLKERCEVLRKNISIADKASFYRAISADANTKHGYNAHGIIFDELHVQRNRELYDALQTGTASRSQPITFIITTAGIKRKGDLGWEMHEHALKVKAGIIKDEHFLVIIYGAGESDDPFLVSTWKKANPNYGISVKEEYMKGESKKAKQQPSYFNTFRRYHLNQWTSSDQIFIKQDDWDKCNLGPIDEESLKGKSCIGALDLASRRDFTALPLVFKLGNIYEVLIRFWIPEDSLDMRKNSEQIRAWADEGYIQLTKGNITDYNYIKEEIRNLSSDYRIEEIAYDPWNSSQLVTDLMDEGANMIEFRQGFKTMSPATKEFEKLILEKRINHGGHPVLAWMNSNTTITIDAADNWKPDKQKSTDRIDGIVALIMCVSRSIFGEEKEEKIVSAYETM